MKHEQTNIFIGMNKDTDIQLLANGDFLDSRNVRIGSSVTNNVGAVELLLGSTEIDTESLQAIAGTDKIIGRCKDYQNGSIYFFIHNDNTPTQYNRIIKLDVNSNTASIVLKDSALFGGSDNPQIVSASIYDSQLFWCNGNDVNTSNTLKHLDLKNNTYSDLDYTDPKEELITVIKIPPVLPITTTLEYDATLNLNKLNDLQYQFAYRFITKSGQFTRFSAVSELSVSGYQLQFDKPNKINITIPFTVDTQLLSRLYSSIEICYRGKYTDDFKSFRKIGFPTTLETSVTTTFVGNEAYTTISASDYTTEFDNVPLYADSVQYADTRVFWGDYSQDRYKQLVLVTETEDAPNGNLEYTPTENSQVLKPNSNYKYAIDLIDKYGRRSTSYVDGTSLDILGSITTNPQTGLVSTLQKKKFTIDLSGVADDYKADGFVQIRRSDNLSVSRFIQGRIEHAYYKTGVDVNGDPIFTEPINWASENYTTFNYLSNPNTTDSGCVELYVDISNWSKSNISYTFAQGDKLRFLTTGLKDTCLGNVNNLSDDKVEYTIKRQEGDILVLDYKNPIEIFGSWSVPNAYDIGGNGYWFFCGSNGFIQRRNSDGTVTEVDNTWTGWYDGIRNTTFYGIIGKLGLISASSIIDESYVCGENGTLLRILWSTKTINKITTNTTSALKDIDGVMINDGGYKWSTFVVGDKNGNGNGTILYIDNDDITDISDDIAFNGDIAKCSTFKNIKGVVSEIMENAWVAFISNTSNSDYYLVKRDLTSGVNTLYTMPLSTHATSYVDINDIGCNKFTDIDITYTKNNIEYGHAMLSLNISTESGYMFRFANISQTAGHPIIDTPIDDVYTTISARTYLGAKLSDYDINSVASLSNKEDNRPLLDWVINGVCVNSNGQALLYWIVPSGSPVVSTYATSFNSKSKLNTVCEFRSALANPLSSDFFIDFLVGGSNKSEEHVFTQLDATPSIPILIPPSESTSIPSIINIINYGAMIEVFTPSSALSDQVYYEIGNVHKISELSPSYELTQEYNDGDCFYIKKQYYGRLWTLPKDYIISMSPNSNTWEYWFKDIARPNTEDLTVDFATAPEQKTAPFKRFTTNIIFSNPYIQGTKTNGLCTFELLNYKQLPIEYGDITALQVANNTNEDGSIMLSIHRHEIVSIYIGKVQYTDVAGNNTISLSDQVLGSYRTTNGSLGSLHKLSIAQFNSKVYGFDAIKGVVWRYGQDGVKRISDVGMINEFYQKGLVAVNDVTYFNQIIGEYNGRFDEYSLTFKNTAETYVWSERVNRWITIREYNSANALQSLNMQCSLYNKNYITTKNGIDGDIGFALYETDVSNDINNLVVGYNDASIQFVANKDVARVKNWNTLKVQCDELWDAYLSNELGQLTFMKDEESEILGTSGDFQQLENDWFAPVLCDTQNSNNDRYVGDSLKSQTLTVNLVLNRGLIIAKGLTNKLVKLYNATITSSISFR